MNVHSSIKEYSVKFIESLNELNQLSHDASCFFVIDSNVYELYRPAFECLDSERLFLLQAVEPHKTLHTALEICERMTDMPSKRNSCLISIGGGIVQDITGFSASILYRGIRWVFYPTTLLAACDSCIGGKTSLNYSGFKNLLGTFYPPDEVRIWPSFVQTLTEGDYLSGLGEVVKFNIMAGENGLVSLEASLAGLLAREDEAVLRFTRESLGFKKPFIEEDEFDRGRRVLLNYAHTFGHAFEVSSEYRIPHGTAVAMGVIAANRVSVGRCMMKTGLAERIESICKKILPEGIQEEWLDDTWILQAIAKDKKRTGKSIRAVLMDDALQLKIFDDIKEDEIIGAVLYLKKEVLSKGLVGQG